MADDLILAKINHVIDELVLSANYVNNRTAERFLKLRTRLKEGKKLTSDMKVDLAWIEKNVVRMSRE